MAEGLKKGAGRPPVPDHLKAKTKTITMRHDQVAWIIKNRKRKGWLSKLVEKSVDAEMKKEIG